jgi:predicted membrane-bound dolichyl-phosphate-mannose-protein mannosyltransferase
MALLGDRALGWRLPSVALGTLSIWLVYKLAVAVGASRNQARAAAFILAFDNLAFVHGRMATLDIYVMTFMLLGTWLYIGRRSELAGLSFGLATLCKLNGVFGYVAVALYETVQFLPRRREPGALRGLLATLGAMSVVYVPFTLCALGALDCAWTPFRGPFEHLAHIVRFGASLTQRFGPQGIASTPIQWWLNEVPIDYLTVHTTVQTAAGGVTKTMVQFRGALNEYVCFAAPFGLVWAAKRALRRGSRFGWLVVCLFVANYVPLLLAWLLAHRTSYIYYVLQALPAIALGIAFVGPTLPKVVRWAFVGSVLFAFAMHFPFRWY